MKLKYNKNKPKRAFQKSAVTILFAAILLCFALSLTACKDDITPPDTPSIEPEPIGSDTMIELIADDTWFDDCGCLKGKIVALSTFTMTENEIKVWFVADTSTSTRPNDALGVFSYSTISFEEELRKEGIELPDYPYFSCPNVYLHIFNKSIEKYPTIKGMYRICNFPVGKFKNIKIPCAFEATIKGTVYQQSYYPPPDYIDDGQLRNAYDLFLTSFKIPQKYKY